MTVTAVSGRTCLREYIFRDATAFGSIIHIAMLVAEDSILLVSLCVPTIESVSDPFDLGIISMTNFSLPR